MSDAATAARGNGRAAGELPAEVDVAIVGAGFGGLGTAIALEREGMRDYLVLERGDDVGGTWHANTYPGCQCDVPSNLYSFSFALNPNWRRSYPEQPELHDYLRECAERFGVDDRIRLRCELREARWSDAEGRWELETSRGTLRARVLIAAPGLLSEPYVPELPGLDRFNGTLFHSADWDHGHDLRGERVALVGTGASAIQIGPRIQPLVERLYVVQRTPPWIIPHPDREIGPRLRRLYRRLPAVQRLVRLGVYSWHELLGTAFFWPAVGRIFALVPRVHMLRQIRDRRLRRRVRPAYAVGCKRMLLSSDWYPMLQEPNVELVDAGMAELRDRSVVMTDGREIPVDTVIVATGFSPTDPPLARRLHGRDGRTLSEAWTQAMRAYKGTTVSGFPNLFLVYGPNTNLAHTSIVYMLEAQIAYVVDALRTMRRRRVAVAEVRPDAEEGWNRWVQQRLAGSVWNTGGCASWYLDRNGDNPIMWPTFTFSFRARLRRFDPAAYRLTGAPAREALTAA